MLDSHRELCWYHFFFLASSRIVPIFLSERVSRPLELRKVPGGSPSFFSAVPTVQSLRNFLAIIVSSSSFIKFCATIPACSIKNLLLSTIGATLTFTASSLVYRKYHSITTLSTFSSEWLSKKGILPAFWTHFPGHIYHLHKVYVCVYVYLITMGRICQDGGNTKFSKGVIDHTLCECTQ